MSYNFKSIPQSIMTYKKSLLQQFEKSGFLKNKPSKILNFKIDEWQHLSLLLSKGYTLTQSFELLGMKQHKIFQMLSSGMNVEEIVVKEAKGDFLETLAFFVQITSLQEAITCAISLYKFKKELKGKFVKKSAYPFFILLFSFLTIHLFSNFILPQLLQSFETEETAILVLLHFIKYTSSILMVVFIVGMLFCMVLRCIHPLNYFFVYKFHKVLPFVKEYISFYLSAYLYELHNSGLSTKEAFHFLSKLKQHFLLQSIANNMIISLHSGKELSICIQEEVLLSNKFKQHYIIGSASNDFSSSMYNFKVLQEYRWMQTIRRASLSIQLISYSFVGVLVICVYQILLLPLQMLEAL